MSVATQRGSEQSAIPARILIAGGNLLAGALANALESHGFATMHVVPREPEIQRGIEWHPNLVILDVRSLDLTAGSGLIGQLHRLDLQVCVIDEADDVDRLNAWMAAGTSALIDGGEPLDQLLRTINRLLRRGSLQQTVQKSSLSMALTHAAGRPQDTRLPHFADLTERERGVLAELMEGHCAEEIAHAACRLNLHRSLTDQGDPPEARRQLPVGRRCARPAGRLVPRQPRGEPPKHSSSRRTHVV